MDLKAKVERLQRMARACKEQYRGDGLAEPALELCEIMLEAMPEEEVKEEPAPPAAVGQTQQPAKAAAKKPQ